LLNAYEIKKPLYACPKFNEESAAEKIIQEVRSGKRVAVLSDAGMPVISDPGNVVCRALIRENIPYTVAPGATAFACALLLSGMDPSKFTFLGFLPNKKGEKIRFLEGYKELDTTLLFHSAPQDVDADVAAMYEVFGERTACAVREITKIHEESVTFSLAEGLSGEKRGEYVLLVEGAKRRENPLNALSEREHIAHYIAQGMDKKDALKHAAKDRGVPKSALYKFTIEE
ncbi:MAG: rRNA small subunit methyltransferase 1, partial [Clostridia bacterium]|nr:rRNA small subunit methyltransferase 1 [Clostridia bacterium]